MSKERRATLPNRLAVELFSVLSRILPATLFSVVAYGFWTNFQSTGKWTSLVWMISEGLVALLLIFRRESTLISKKPWDWIVGIAGTLFVLLVRPAENRIAPEAISVAIQVAGNMIAVYGKLALGRSFGIVAAHRGIVASGPYRFVRHPIYLGYLVTHIGFLLSNLSSRNLGVYFVAYVFQIFRIFSEERLLCEDESYRKYREQVRYRLIPGIF